MCAMCSQPPRSSVDRWRFPFFQRAIELSKQDSIIGISGGEPTLYKHDLFNILENTANLRSDVMLHILSNGQHFEDEDMPKLNNIHENLNILWGIPLYSHDYKNHDEIAEEIGTDWQIYQNLEDLIESVGEGNPDIKEFETSIFTGEYITPLGENYLADLENSRQDELKMQREKSASQG